MSADNKQIKDGIGDLFSLRMKDVSSGGDGSLQRSMVLASLYPLDHGVGGSFQATSKSGTMAAGLAAASPIYAFQWTSATLLAAVKRINLQAWTLDTAFVAGISAFDGYVARGFTVQDTGGAGETLSGNNVKMRTSLGSSAANIRHATTATLVAGTRTLDANPFTTTNNTATLAAYTLFVPETAFKFFDRLQGEHPLILAENEGFVIQATVPATGTWGFSVTPEWDEIPLF